MSGSDCDGGEIRRVGGRGGDDDGSCKQQQQVPEGEEMTNKKVNKKRHDFNNGAKRNLGSGIGLGCCFPRSLAKAAAVTKTKAEKKTESRRPSCSCSCSPGKCIGFRHCCCGFNKGSSPPPPIPASQQSSSLPTAASDPNAPNFTADMLRILIERNDFYCRECNPHLITNS
ncbi:unnamed protein product [Linum trigynum]|uniref:Uncharacterized protein n=1 Tax=Linum trigynum TaxID=586398 RepID=A0AAV2F4Q3_9ROSI